MKIKLNKTLLSKNIDICNMHKQVYICFQFHHLWIFVTNCNGSSKQDILKDEKNVDFAMFYAFHTTDFVTMKSNVDT